MKELSKTSLNHVAGGSVHWHLDSHGKASGGNDSFKSLPNSALSFGNNSTSGKAIATAVGGLLGSAFGPAGSAAGAALGQVAGAITSK